MGDRENTRRAARIALQRAEKAVAQERSNGYALGVGVGALAALGETDWAKDWRGAEDPALPAHARGWAFA